MKLELKHLAPYLPYGLRLQYHDTKIGTLNSLSDINEYDDIKISINYGELEHIWMFKPILRPMSDFDKPLGQESDIYSYLMKYNQGREECAQIDGDLDFDINEPIWLSAKLGYEVHLFLFEHHFDVFGLIPAGLAVDINTMKS